MSAAENVGSLGRLAEGKAQRGSLPWEDAPPLIDVRRPRFLPAWLTELPSRRLRSTLTILVLALMALGAAVRCFEYDESYTQFYLAGLPHPQWPVEPRTVGALRSWVEGRTTGVLQVVTDLMRYETHPPLHFWLLIPWRAAFGSDPLVLRLFSLLCACGSILAVWRLAALARVPAVPAVLCAFLSYAVFYPTTLARAYALALMLVLLGTLALARLLRDPERGCRRWMDGAVSAAAAGMAFGLAGLSHYLALLAGAAILGAFALNALAQRRLLPVLASGLGVLPPFLGVVALRHEQGSAEWFHAGFELSRDLWRMLEMQAAALFARTPLLLDEPWSDLVALLIAPSVMLIVGPVLMAFRPIMADPVRRLLLAGAVAMPLGLLVLGVLTDRAPFVSRYTSYSIPFIALSFAAGLAHLAERGQRRLAAIVFGYVLLWQTIGAGSQVLWPATQQEFRPIIADVAQRWVPDKSVLAVPVGYDHIGKNGPYLWEAPVDWPMVVVNTHVPAAETVARLGAANRLFLVTFVEKSGEAVLEVLPPALRDAGWRLVETREHVQVWSR